MYNNENTYSNVKTLTQGKKAKESTIKPTRKDSNEIALIMQNMTGWERQETPRKFKDYGSQKVWKSDRLEL